ncbi:hypothetical protein AK812_SmicGene9976 [Symbiodinium microadriaticum]|uniref:Uncharacterized protein n=1 Tax=Symbiodinium microadriaticum TaxID=2951 RepID=A0A1Q9EGX4_SYMMI|nr:hypothetical protein AK812_SmicGene9976 [Symbiodinium microadriaticum]
MKAALCLVAGQDWKVDEQWKAADLFADTLLGMVWLPLDKEACAALRAVTLPCCACCSCAAEEFVLVRPEAASGKRGLLDELACFVGTAAKVQRKVFQRQAKGLSTTDKVLFLWALAKCKVVHLALCRLIVRDLAVENCGNLQRDKVGLALWSLAVVWPSLPQSESWARLLASTLLAAQPWQLAPSYEVTNDAWAFTQLPPDLTSMMWPSLLSSASQITPSSLSQHELCNLMAGLSRCPKDVILCHDVFTSFAQEAATLACQPQNWKYMKAFVRNSEPRSRDAQAEDYEDEEEGEEAREAKEGSAHSHDETCSDPEAKCHCGEKASKSSQTKTLG